MSPTRVLDIKWDSFANIVDGKPRGSKETHQGIDPTTGEKLWDVPVASKQDVDDAVAAAKKAFRSWAKTPFDKRKELLGEFAKLFDEYKDQMTDLLCKETGKPRMFAAQEVAGVAGWCGHHATLTLPEEVVEDDEKVITTRYVPLGVVGAITPWNFPLILSIGKIAPAILAGDCIIVKPSPYTPYTTLKMVELAQEIFPPGVIEAVGGSDALGPMLTSHPDIAKISFTGSIATGKKIMAACAGTLKRVSLELGGNDAAIVLPDVDIEKTAPEVAMGAFYNSGQVCVATKRIYVHEKIYRPFVDAMVKFTKTLKVGSSDDEGVMMGPIQNSMQYEKVKTFFSDSKDYDFVAGEKEVKKGKGYFINPTIIDNPPKDSRIVQEEPFGPIVPVMPWSDEAEVIERANDTTTGLGACVYGKDVKHAEEIGWQLQAGSVFINSFEKPTPQAFFGGHKESGIGGEWGQLGVLSYCNALVLHSYKNKQ